MTSISNSHFGDHTIIHQGNVQGNVYYGAPPNAPARPEVAQVVRIIPYPRNEDIVHRRNLIDKLDRFLPQTSGYCSAALWGLGGSGKTQIALDYVYRRCDADDKCCVFWVHAESEATFLADFTVIGKNLGVDVERLNGSDLLDTVRGAIEGRSSKWVMIIDNADDLRLFGVGQQAKDEETNGNLNKYIPHGSQGTLLWTTRDAHVAGTLVGACRSIEVQSMAIDEATILLERARGEPLAMEKLEDQAEGVDTLLEELQCLPLAISQAGAFMRRVSMTAKEYLSLLRQGKTRWEVLGVSDTDRYRRPDVSNSVLETWRISAERIRVESETSYRILHILAYVDNQDIPQELIVAAVAQCHDDEDNQDGRDDQYDDEKKDNRDDRDDRDSIIQVTELEVLKAITRLKEFSFLSLRQTTDDRRSYEMHKLVQEALRYGLRMKTGTPSYKASGDDGPIQAEVLYGRRALKVVDGFFPQPDWASWVPDRAYWAPSERYFTHAIRVAEWAEVSDTEAQTANLLQKLSYLLCAQARWREKEPVDSQLLRLRRKMLGEKHPDTIRSMSDLATTLHALGHYSEETAVEVLEMRQQVLGEKHPDTIQSKADLAGLYHTLGRYTKAEGIYQEVLEFQRQVLGDRHPFTIRAMEDLAATHHAQGHYSEKTAVQILEIRQQVLGEKHPDTIRSKAGVAGLYHTLGQYTKAESIYQEVLRLQQEALGERHPDTIRFKGNLAALYYAKGQLREAEEIHQEVLRLLKEVLGEKHPDTIKSIADLAAIYSSHGQFSKAKDIHQEVLQIQQNVFGEKHPNTIRSKASLAVIYYVQKQYSKSQEMQQEVIQLRQEVLGEKHPDTIASIADLGSTCYRRGQYDEAEKLLDKALKLQREVLGEKHPSLLKSMAELAALYGEQRQYSKAKDISQEILRLRQEVLGERHPDTISILASLAVICHNLACHDQGQFQEAEQLHLAAIALSRQVLGDDHPDTMQRIKFLASTQRELRREQRLWLRNLWRFMCRKVEGGS